jgi:hypothetical protein
MSRTDKDAPWWVRSTYYTPTHRASCKLGWHDEPCNLDPEPVRIHRSAYGRFIYRTRCIWEAERHCYRPPTREDRHLDWWGPDRAEVRDFCRMAKRDHGGYGELLEPIRQHRHASYKGWWW